MHRTAVLSWRVFRLFAACEDRGVAAVEFALYALVFLMIVAAVVDIGLLLFTAAELDAAVAAGAQYAANNATLVGSDPATLANEIQGVVANANSAGWASSTVNVNNSNDSAHCYCPSGTPGSWSWGSTVTCGGSCGAGGGIGGQFVTITASRAISPLFPSFGFIASGSLTRSALVETE